MSIEFSIQQAKNEHAIHVTVGVKLDFSGFQINLWKNVCNLHIQETLF